MIIQACIIQAQDDAKTHVEIALTIHLKPPHTHELIKMKFYVLHPYMQDTDEIAASQMSNCACYLAEPKVKGKHAYMSSCDFCIMDLQCVKQWP